MNNNAVRAVPAMPVATGHERLKYQTNPATIANANSKPIWRGRAREGTSSTALTEPSSLEAKALSENVSSTRRWPLAPVDGNRKKRWGPRSESTYGGARG